MPQRLRPAVRRLLARRNISGAELARRTGIHPSKISRGLSGRREFSAPEWRRICAALGLLEAVVACVVELIERA